MIWSCNYINDTSIHTECMIYDVGINGLLIILGIFIIIKLIIKMYNLKKLKKEKGE